MAVRISDPTDRTERVIRAEIERRRPIDLARETLVLMALGRIRPMEGDSSRVTILDERHEPTGKEREYSSLASAAKDLLDDLQRRHPTLFESPVPAAASPPAERDWLLVGADARRSDEGTDEAGPLPPGEARTPPPPTPERQAGFFRRVLMRRRRRESPGWERSGTPRGGRRYARGTGALVGGTRRLALTLLAVLALVSLYGFWTLNTPEEGTPPPVAAEPALADPETTGSVTPASPIAAPETLSGIPEVIDTITLRIDGQVVRLYGLEWARGGIAEELRGYLSGRPVTCEALPDLEAYRCLVEGRDLSRVVLFNGGARASPQAPPELAAAERRAREAGIGVWSR